MNRYLAETNKICSPAPLLSIVLTSYNHAQFICERLDSIYCQSFSDFELIILDDASPDNSVAIIKGYLEGKDYTIIQNSVNSGSPFAQWETGLSLARGKFVWIAESDDSCKPDFVSSLLPVLDSGCVTIAFSRAASIDKDGLLLSNAYWPEEQCAIFFASNQTIPCKSFLSRYQLARNCIPNVSSAIFLVQGFKHELIAAARHASAYRFVGDWIFWNQLLKVYDNNKIYYCSTPLCLHRSHSGTTRVELSRNAERIRVREYSRAVNHALRMLGNSALPAFFHAVTSRWWDWSYEQYLKRYRPSPAERLIGSPQYGLHLLGYLFFLVRLIPRRYFPPLA